MTFASWLISMKLILGSQKTESVGNIIQTGMKRYSLLKLEQN